MSIDLLHPRLSVSRTSCKLELCAVELPAPRIDRSGAVHVHVSKYDGDGVELSVANTGDEEARVADVRNGLTRKESELSRQIIVSNLIKRQSGTTSSARRLNPPAPEILICIVAAV